MKTKTIDIVALEWFDRINGNSYFAGTVTINHGMKDKSSFTMPFQYGYGSQYEQEAKAELIKRGYVTLYRESQGLWDYCRENNIILRSQKIDKCLKRELKAIDKYHYSHQ